MALFDLNAIIIYITLGLIFVIFLMFDIFRKGEKYSLLGYLMALPIVNYLWFKLTETNFQEYEAFGVLGVYFILVLLWIVVMLRDFVMIIRKKKDVDDVLLFLLIALIVQFVLTALLPANTLLPTMQEGCSLYLGFFWLPELYTDPITGVINNVLDPSVVLMFRISVSLLIILICIPLVNDLRGEEVNFVSVIVITALFILPFLLLSYIWAPASTPVLTFLFSVIFFIVLLLVTKKDRTISDKKG